MSLFVNKRRLKRQTVWVSFRRTAVCTDTATRSKTTFLSVPPDHTAHIGRWGCPTAAPNRGCICATSRSRCQCPLPLGRTARRGCRCHRCWSCFRQSEAVCLLSQHHKRTHR